MLGLPLLSDIRNDPEMNNFWGVDRPATVEVSGKEVERDIFRFSLFGETVKIYRFPGFWLTEDVMAWNNEYKYTTGGHIPYVNTNPKYHAACGIYESYMAKFRGKK